MSQSFEDIGESTRGLDIVRIGPAVDTGGDPADFMVMTGALIHIDIDVGEFKSFESHADALAHIDFVMADKKYCGTSYKTYSGVRVILTHTLAYPKDCEEELNAFMIDEWYKKACLHLNQWRIRITAKPGREEAIVAEPYAEYAYRERDPLAVRLQEVHDRICCHEYLPVNTEDPAVRLASYNLHNL